MLKKIFLLSILFTHIMPSYQNNDYYYRKNKHDDGLKTAALIAGGIGTLGTVVYWAKRENNDCLIARAQRLIDQNQQLFLDAQVEDNSYLIINFRKNLEQIYKIICGRYNSYLKPWNWSYKMRQARDHIETVFKRIDQVLYQFTIRRVESFNVSATNFLHRIIENVINDYFGSLTNILEQKRVLQHELSQFFATSSILQTELEERNPNIDFTIKNIYAEQDFKKLLEQARFLHIVLKYSDCTKYLQNDAMLLKETRKFIGSSSYPYKDFIQLLEHDMNTIKKMYTSSDYQNYLDLLRKIYISVIASQEYIDERRAYELYLEQKRQTEAAIQAALSASRTATATQDAASAAHRQARALEEQNRLTRERNNIERNKNNNNDNNDRW